ncbi:hypothetical protein D9M70_632330 [compost metagenome]
MTTDVIALCIEIRFAVFVVLRTIIYFFVGIIDGAFDAVTAIIAPVIAIVAGRVMTLVLVAFRTPAIIAPSTAPAATAPTSCPR